MSKMVKTYCSGGQTLLRRANQARGGQHVQQKEATRLQNDMASYGENHSQSPKTVHFFLH